MSFKVAILILIVIVVIVFVCRGYFLKQLHAVVHADGRGPVFPYQQYPQLNVLKENWKGIRDEFQLSRHIEKPIRGDRYFSENLIETDKWKRVYLKWYAKPWSHTDKFPFTTNLLKSMPGLRSAMFSIMDPGTIVKPHHGLNPANLRVHLGLITPDSDECFIIVEGKKYTWTDGELLVFDDTYLHEVQNNTDQERVILFLDIERDDRLITKFSNILSVLIEMTSKRD
jgi:beta-hydroxylase